MVSPNESLTKVLSVTICANLRDDTLHNSKPSVGLCRVFARVRKHSSFPAGQSYTSAQTRTESTELHVRGFGEDDIVSTTMAVVVEVSQRICSVRFVYVLVRKIQLENFLTKFSGDAERSDNVTWQVDTT